jgi:hypothetical protein
MSNSQLQQKIQEKIEQDNIQPIGKWFFDVQNAGLWFLGGVTLIIGSVAVAITLNATLSTHWRYVDATEFGRAKFLFSSLPLLWIAIAAIFLYLTEREVRNTKYGYKYATLTLGVFLVGASVVFGGGLYAAGVGAVADDTLAHHLPAYKKIGNPQYIIWTAPEEGRLAGIIAMVEDENTFVLLDLEGKLWNIDARNAKKPISLLIQEEERLKLLGKVQAEEDFLAKVVLPFHSHVDAIKVLEYRAMLKKYQVHERLEQSRERNYSPGRTSEVKGLSN